MQKIYATSRLVDAKLAEATARSIKAQQAADALQEDSRVLRKEIDRKTK